MAERWRYNQGDHPANCTCVACTQERLKRAREAKAGDADGALAPVLSPLRRLLNRLTGAFR